MKGYEKANLVRKPELVYECLDYKIEKIPLNYRGLIKCAIQPKHAFRGLDRDHYIQVEHSVQDLKNILEQEVKMYYISGKLPDIPKGIKTSQAKEIAKGIKL